MSEEVRNALLVFVGAVLVLIVVDGSYVRYVRPGAGALLLAAGLVIVALALVDVVRDLRRPAADPDGPAADPAADPADGPAVDPAVEAAGHAHGGSGRAAWLLLVPVLVVLLVSPPALGADAVRLAGDRTARVAAAPAEPLPPGPAPALALVDLVARAAGDPTAVATLAGREVTLVGFLVPARDGSGSDLTRLVVSCCAADASPVRVHLADPASAAAAAATQAPPARDGAPAERWVRVRGAHVAGTGTAADGFVPTVAVAAAAPVAAPVPPYEY